MTDAKCPKCNSAMEDIGGKLVCSSCYHVLDGPGSASSAAGTAQQAIPTAAADMGAPVKLSKDPNAPLPIITSQPAPALSSRPCPKCGSECNDVGGGRLVCSKCYNVIDGQPTQPTPYSQYSSNQPAPNSGMTAFGIAVAVLFVIVLVFVIRFNQSHNASAIPDTTTTTSTTTGLPGTPVHPNLPGTPVPPQLPGTPVHPDLPGTPVPPQLPGTPVHPDLPGTPVPPQPTNNVGGNPNSNGS